MRVRACYVLASSWFRLLERLREVNIHNDAAVTTTMVGHAAEFDRAVVQRPFLSDNWTISLWLLPPEPIMASLRCIQSDIISYHKIEADRHLPKFLPHITLIGGVPIAETMTIDEVTSFSRHCLQEDERKDAAGKAVLERLQLAFQSYEYEGVSCTSVEKRGVVYGNTWNQACVSIIERNDSLMRAIELADGAMFSGGGNANDGNDDKQNTAYSIQLERHFKSPTSEPHFSFVYGNDVKCLPSLKCPSSFVSSEMALVWTPTKDLDGVHADDFDQKLKEIVEEKWEVIGRVQLIERGNGHGKSI